MSRSGKNHVYLLGIITAICLLGDSMLYVVLPIHWESMGLSSLWEVGILLSINRFIRLPLNPFVERIYRKISLKHGITLAIMLAVLTTLSYGFLNSFWLLFIARSIWGIAWSFLRLGALFAIIDLSDTTNRGHLMGSFNGIYRLGSLFGMLLGGLFADIYSADVAAYAFGIATVCALPFVMKFQASSTVPESAVQNTQLSLPYSFWKNTAFLWTIASGALIAMIYQGIFTSSLSHLVYVTHSSTISIIGIVVGATTLAGLIQAIRWGWEPLLAPWFGKLSDGRIGRQKILGFTLLLAAVLFFIIPYKFNILLWLIAVLAVQLTATVLTTLMDAIAMDNVHASSKRTMMTVYSMSTDVGAAMGPFLGYFVTMSFGIKTTLWIASAIALLLCIKWIFSLQRKTSKKIDFTY